MVEVELQDRTNNSAVGKGAPRRDEFATVVGDNDGGSTFEAIYDELRHDAYCPDDSCSAVMRDPVTALPAPSSYIPPAP